MMSGLWTGRRLPCALVAAALVMPPAPAFCETGKPSTWAASVQRAIDASSSSAKSRSPTKKVQKRPIAKSAAPAAALVPTSVSPQRQEPISNEPRSADAAEPKSKEEPAKEDDAAPPALPAPQAGAVTPEPDEKAQQKASAPSPPSNGADDKAVQSFCVNIANAASDARHRQQLKQLDGLKADLQQRTAALEGKIAEYKDWLSRRTAFAIKIRESLVGIYSSMKPEAAAKQIAELDEETAAALIAKLEPRQSSAILSEMEAKKAARLMDFISGAGRTEDTAAADAATPEPSGARPAVSDAPDAPKANAGEHKP